MSVDQMAGDVGLVVAGIVTQLWCGMSIEDVIALQGEPEEGELVAFTADVAVPNMLWDGEVLSLPPPSPPEPRLIAKGLVVERLTAAGKAAAFQAAMLADPTGFFTYWVTPGAPIILADDDRLAAVLVAAGADVAVITAP